MDDAWEEAIKRGDVQAVRDLLGQGLDVDARDRYGQTGLMLAAQAGYGEVVETLIVHQAIILCLGQKGERLQWKMARFRALPAIY
jgi:ankyrin repeat protein